MTTESGHIARRTLRIEADSRRLADVRRFVEEVAVDLSLGPERVFDLKVAVSEACANAVEHAGSTTARVEVCAWVYPERLTITVMDEGEFHPPSLPRESLESRGLGMPLMVALMDEVSFSRTPEGGTTVSLSVLLRETAPLPA